jgi:hypothetical protein
LDVFVTIAGDIGVILFASLVSSPSSWSSSGAATCGPGTLEGDELRAAAAPRIGDTAGE